MRFFIVFLYLFFGICAPGFAQSFTSYRTGGAENIDINPLGGICLMGGGSENDDGMRWFLERAQGGDILVFRTSGSDGYNDYLYTELGAEVHSVETIVCHNASASVSAYIIQRIQEAEGIWFAGGDQSEYVSFWRDTPIAQEVNKAVSERSIVIGGTSAGMAILGDFYFSASRGTIRSNEALANPFHEAITVDTQQFIDIPLLSRTITDTHYDNPDRKGRQVTFLARLALDVGFPVRGIACEEYTSVCISPEGEARVFGSWPEYDDQAYFIQNNCSIADGLPEQIKPNMPLEWKHNRESLVVYRILGTPQGDRTFQLDSWASGSGGQWFFWSVENGQLAEQSGQVVDCALTSTPEIHITSFSIFPLPAATGQKITVEGWREEWGIPHLRNAMGQTVRFGTEVRRVGQEVTIVSYQPGLFWLLGTESSNFQPKPLFIMGQ